MVLDVNLTIIGGLCLLVGLVAALVSESLRRDEGLARQESMRTGSLFDNPKAGANRWSSSVTPVWAPRPFNASHAARCAARHGVRSHAVLVALVGLCSMPVV